MNKKGFTLIELLVVIAIIGLLSTLAVVALSSARTKARDSKRLSDLKQVQTALELYFTDNNGYPTASVTLGATSAACLNTSGFSTLGCSNPYMGNVPADPRSGSYSYVSTASTSYRITATLEGTMSGMSGTIYATQNGISTTST
ncbi:MAG: prepilin-type N-terminal cleavage/methylation domain-containing protein [bacterium]